MELKYVQKPRTTNMNKRVLERKSWLRGSAAKKKKCNQNSVYERSALLSLSERTKCEDIS